MPLAQQNMVSNTRPKINNWRWTRSALAKQLFVYCRWLHVYISTTLLCILLFFCLTGLTLNHPNWTGTPEHKVDKIYLPASILPSLKNPNTATIVLLEKQIEQLTQLRNPRSIDADWSLAEVSFDYPLPGGYVFVIAHLDQASLSMEYQRGSPLSLINDLHKGRHSGQAWSWLIDLSAIAIMLFSISGLVILLQHKRQRISGLFAVLLGFAAPWLVYALMVPTY